MVELKKQGSDQTIRIPSRYYPVANSAISKYFNISLSKAYRLKVKARNAKFISVKNVFIPLTDLNENLHFIKDIDIEIFRRVRNVNGILGFDAVDMISSDMRFRTRKKLKTYNKQYKGEKKKGTTSE